MTDASSEVEEGVYGDPILCAAPGNFVAAPNAYEELKTRFDAFEEAQEQAAKRSGGSLAFLVLAVVSGVLACAVIALGVVAVLAGQEIGSLRER
ncbi:hypothetical protein KIPB_010340 [Kipferlia bialata]|uniref:Uncharacterized protein n=1 Tax=Kipferlia bialata TaxID=797122 RepID=A0A391NPT2_9EUKA|nr:hypothetical protein KIPB_010340 [Kipferlia bialata]|eukprot:g10340.t1